MKNNNIRKKENKRVKGFGFRSNQMFLVYF